MKIVEGGLGLLLLSIFNYVYVLIGNTADLSYFAGAIVGAMIIIVIGIVWSLIMNKDIEARKDILK